MRKIKIIYENSSINPEVKPEWGFSALLEYQGKKILFDTGGNPKIFADNLSALKCAPQDIDIVVISHDHWDHTSGFGVVLHRKQDVYLLKSFSQELKSKVIDSGAKLHEVFDSLEIVPGVYTTGSLGGGIKEQSLIVDLPEGLLLLCGCSHPGIVAIVRRVEQLMNKKVNFVIGGFHLYLFDVSEIENIANQIKTLGVEKSAPCHCTGEKAVSIFKEKLCKGFVEIAAGSVIDLG